MRPAGWALLIASWGIIIGALAFCFYKIFSKKSDGQGEENNGNEN
ncbi:MAG: hypothetical protein QME32_02560 [Endomicrobiia bacterium]|nr:hypothetical protein [Endomicrobiia bacterium]